MNNIQVTHLVLTDLAVLRAVSCDRNTSFLVYPVALTYSSSLSSFSGALRPICLCLSMFRSRKMAWVRAKKRSLCDIGFTVDMVEVALLSFPDF